MDKLEELKEAIIARHDKMLSRLTKGYPTVIDNDLLCAIKAVDDIECYTLTTLRRDILINYYLMKLRQNGK